MKRLRLLDVGCGHVARGMQGPALGTVAAEPDTDLAVTLSDIRPRAWGDLLNALSEEHRRTAREKFRFLDVRDPDLLIDVRSGRFDWAIISTPPQSHAQYVRELAPFCRVLVEKPPTPTVAELGRLNDWLEARDLVRNVWFLDHYRLRWGPRYIIQNLLPEVGTIQAVRYRSCEGQHCWEAPVFAIGEDKDGKPLYGYSWEHVCHAFGLLDLVCPIQDPAELTTNSAQRKKSDLIVDKPGSTTPAKKVTVPDTYLSAQQVLQTGPDTKVEVDILGAKSMQADSKAWTIKGDQATVTWEWKPEEKITVTRGEDVVEEIRPAAHDITKPYEYLVRALLRNDTSLLLGGRRAERLLECLRGAVEKAGDIESYAAGKLDE